MAAAFPTAVKSFLQVVNGVTKLVASLFNSAYDEIEAVETFLSSANSFAKAYISANQSIPASTATKVTCNTEVYDNNSEYDNASNYRFTPTLAGKYLAIGQTKWNSVQSGRYPKIMLYKNGSVIAEALSLPGADASIATQNISTIVDMNGTTDYIELYAYHSADAAIELTAGEPATFLAVHGLSDIKV